MKQFLVRALACLMTFIALSFLYASSFSKASQTAPELVFIVGEQDHVNEIAEKLQQKGIVLTGLGYRAYAWLDSSAKHAVLGSYRLKPGMSYHDIARVLALGPERHEGTVRIIEGWTLKDIQQNLSQERGIERVKMEAMMGTVADGRAFDSRLREDFAFLKSLPKTRSLEGYLFPDTYRIWEDQLPEGLVRKQLGEFRDRYGSVQIDSSIAPLKSIDEVVILASIIEKEVRGAEDRKMVAGIFLRRLKEGMPLQSDATLNYVTQSGSSRASREELALDSPYNSYKYRGLPPGPICNPGATALEAVLHPKTSPYRFFLTDKEGKVLYAQTFEEHGRNRQKAGY